MLNTPINTSGGGTDFNNEDQLYQMAQSYGGAIADSANEISHPQTGILSSIGDGFKNAFKGFVDAISIPSEIVAGTISNKETIGSAIDKHLSIDQALFGDTNIFGNQDGTQTTIQKVGGFLVRAAPDVLLDPLTWVGLGPEGKAMKIKTLTDAGVSAKYAIENELATGTHNEDLLSNAYKRNAVDAGVQPENLQDTVDNAIANHNPNNINDFVKKNYIDNRMFQIEQETGKPLQELKSLSQTGENMVLKYADMQKQGMVQTFYKQEAIDMMEHTGSTFDEAMSKVKDMVETKQYDQAFLEQTINAPLDIEKAKEAVANLITRRPGFSESLIDKGGLKFMGRTLLEGQRIQKAIDAVPGYHAVEENLVSFRKAVFGIDANTKEYSSIERQYADLAKSKKNEALTKVAQIFHANKITGPEANMITSAIEYGRMPVDEKMKALFLNAHGIDYNSIYNDERLSNAIRAVTNMNQINYDEAISRGIALSRKDNYMAHLAPIEKLDKTNFANISASSKLAASKSTSILRYRNTETGELAFNNGKYVGDAEHMAMKQYDPNMMQKVKEQALVETEKRYDIKIQDIEHESNSIQTKIQDFFKSNSIEQFKDMVSKIPGTKGEDVQSAGRVMKEFMDNHAGVDIQGMKESRIKATENFNTNIGNVLKSSSSEIKDALQKVIDNNSRIVNEVPKLGEDINTSLANSLSNIDIKKVEEGLSTVTKDGIITPEAKELIGKMKDANKTLSDELIKNSMDKDVMNDWVDKMTTEFEQNPVGVKHLLNSLIGKDNVMSKLLLEASDKRLSLMKEIDKNSELSMMDGKLFRSKDGAIFRAERPAILEAEDNGFHYEQNALAIMFRSSLDTVKATISHDFISDIAMKFGRLESEAPDKWREVSVSGLKDAPKNLSNYLTGRNGEKILFHPDIAKKIENFNASVINDEDINAILKKFDDITRVFKASVTSIFPAFHGRNAITNVLNSWLDIGSAALNPARHVASANMVKSSYKIEGLKARLLAGDNTANAELYAEMAKDAFTDKRGYTWSMGQMHQILKDKNIALGNQFVGRADIEGHASLDALPQLQTKLFGDPNETKLGKTVRVAKEIGKQPFEKGQQFGQMIEDHSRIIHFLEHVDKTGDVGLAAERTKMFLFDYGDLSNFEREYMKRIIPFYTWIKKNVELQTKVLMSTPGKLSNQVQVFNTLSRVMSNGQGLTDEEYNTLPDYIKGNFNLVTSRNGSKLHVVSNIGSPLEAAFNALNPNTALSGVNPLINLPIELTTGYDVFRGGMMSDTNNAKLLKDAPQVAKDLVGFVHYKYKDNSGNWVDRYTATNPKMFFLLMNQPFGSRVFNQYLRTESQIKAGTITSPSETLKELTGMTSNDFDDTTLTAQAQKKRVQELQDLLSKSGIIYKMNKPEKSKNTQIIEN